MINKQLIDFTNAIVRNDLNYIIRLKERGVILKEVSTMAVYDACVRIMSFGVNNTDILCYLLDNGCKYEDEIVFLEKLSEEYPELKKYLN